jgi:hypothetical protein
MLPAWEGLLRPIPGGVDHEEIWKKYLNYILLFYHFNS